MLSIFIVGLLLYSSYARQLMSIEGDTSTLQWVAVIDVAGDNLVNCEGIRERVDQLIADFNNDDGGNSEVFSQESAYSSAYSSGNFMHSESLVNEKDCFIAFTGPEDLATFVDDNVDEIVKMEPNEEIIGFGTQQWGQDRVDQDSLPLDGANYNPIYTGSGQHLYVIDTGINLKHNEFDGGERASYGFDATAEFTDSNDGNGHGTHVASIAVGKSTGIAPKATVTGVKALTSSGSGSTTGVIKCIHWAIDDATQTSVINLSLGGGLSSALNQAVNTAAESHIVVVAAGNSATDACKSSPSSATGQNVLTVGATTKTDSMASYSNYGKCVDILAPGSGIKAAYKGSTSSYATMSGTSMATPQVAGIALQALEKHNGNLAAAVADIQANIIPYVISGLDEETPNELARVFTYTGPPTPPTVQPTRAPTYSPPRICLNGKTNNKNCILEEAYALSLFGSAPPSRGDTPMTGTIVLASGDGLLCSKTSQKFTGKIVVVYRGDCLFFDKVKIADNKGAKAVIIINTEGYDIFQPTYYGNEAVSIPSVMVSYKDGVELLKDGDTLAWGSLELLQELESTSTPTSSPAESSCESITKRKTCKKESSCEWKSKKCVAKEIVENEGIREDM